MSDISLLIHQIEQAKSINETNALIDKLSEFGDEVIQPLRNEYLHALPLKKGKRVIVLRIYQRMGYPKNKNAIPYMVDIVSDINSPGWELAIQELVKIGSPATNEIRNALNYYSDNYAENGTEYEGLCSLIKEMGLPVIKQLAPDLQKLVEEGTESIKSNAREVLEMIDKENSK